MNVWRESGFPATFLVDVAPASVMRDGLLRVSEAAELGWGDMELAGDGSGRIRIPESKTDQEGEGTVLYLGPAVVEGLLAIRPEEAVIDGSTAEAVRILIDPSCITRTCNSRAGPRGCLTSTMTWPMRTGQGCIPISWAVPGPCRTNKTSDTNVGDLTDVQAWIGYHVT